MLIPKQTKASTIAVLGAGDLVSHLRRSDGADGDATYFFNIYRESPNGKVTHLLCTDSLHDLLNLSYVVAFAVLDDGWITEEQRDELKHLIEKLDSIRQKEADQDG